MNKATEKTAEWWNDPQSQPPGTQWVEVPTIGANVNRRASGDPAIDWLDHSAIFLSEQPRPIKALSVGCGFGIIERILRQRDICQLIHGLDVAEGAIQGAIQQAEAEGLQGLTYEVADLNTAKLPEENYDVVYAHASLHHVFQLEHLFEQIKKTLKPGGFFITYEYVGPSQMQFPQHHLQLADFFLKSIPERYRRTRRREGFKQEAPRFSLERMNSSDPSEGIRASEIVPLVASRFEIRYLRYLAGTLLLLIFNEIAGNFREDDAEIMPLVNALISLDNFMVDNAILPSYHVYMVCQKTDNPLPMQTVNVVSLATPVFATNNPQPLNSPTASVIADPNPLIVDPPAPGQVTLSWKSYGTRRVEIHVDDPNGKMFAGSGPGCFSKKTGQWTRVGMTFYLQNVSNGLPLTADNTLAKVTLTAPQ
ncbi:MAG TPA: class I SAM-dependent methyltransferase [Terriglobales bacterium]|nr:class I SAM-dependent methyltransferase [Terriglobales bacterium]